MKTEVIAWWGAILATIVFLWDVYKWRRDRFFLHVGAVGGAGVEEDQVRVSISNRGGKATTIEGIFLSNYRYILWAMLLRGRRRSLFKTNLPVAAKEKHLLPAVLQPGEVFRTTADLNVDRRDPLAEDDLRELAIEGRLFLHVKCSHANRAYRTRVSRWSPLTDS